MNMLGSMLKTLTFVFFSRYSFEHFFHLPNSNIDGIGSSPFGAIHGLRKWMAKGRVAKLRE